VEYGEAKRYLIGFFAIWGTTLAALLGAAFLNDKPEDALSAGRIEERIPRIAKRVEALRDLRFRELPDSHVVSVRDLRDEADEEIQSPKVVRRLREGEEVLKVLGLLAPDDNVTELAGSSADIVVGFFDPKENELALVRSAEPRSPVEVGITLAHELTHALEEQRLGIEKGDEEDPISDDRRSAQAALIEGSATAVGFEYADRYLTDEQGLTEFLGEALLGGSDSSELPGFVQVEASFTYGEGKLFVEHLYQLAQGWKLVNLALASRPPASTEQVFHPRKYLLDERPVLVEVEAKSVLGTGWERVTSSTLGELDSLQLLVGAPLASDPARAAEGWGGGRYELWRRGSLTDSDCAAPCRSRDALILSWRWDTLVDAREFARGIRAYVEDGLGATKAGDSRWRFKGSSIAYAEQGRATALVFAPDRATAIGLAEANAGS
jgi:hypothetical protein